MSFDAKKAEDILRHVTGDELPAVFLSHEGESMAVTRDESGAPDVTYSAVKDGKDISLHGDEVVITDGDELRFYKYDEGGMLARAERLFTLPDGKMGEGGVDMAQRQADETLISSVRLMYSKAIERTDDFKVESLEV